MLVQGSKPRVVARLRDGRMVKGYLEEPDVRLYANTHLPQEVPLREQVRVRLPDSNEALAIPTHSLKALFFVKSFEGNSEYQEVKFFGKNPPIQGLWVQIKFYDSECLEGVVRNDIHFLLGAGFLLRLPDPASNNEALYVVKSSLSDFRVLGVRTEY